MFWKRKRNPADFADEIRAHLQIEADELKSEGHPDSPSAAHRAFGNVTALRERSYERGRWAWADELCQDVRYALRTMRRSPAFTAGTAVLLALGIGANTAVYSFVEAIVLRSLPVPAPHDLVLFKWRAPDNPKVKRSISGESHRDPELGYVSGNFPYRAFEFLAANNTVLSTTFGFFGREMTVLGNGRAERAGVLFASGSFFGGLQLVPAQGRLLDPQDERPDAPRVAVLSHSYWQARFGGNPAAVGQTIQVNNTPFLVVGVAPGGFFGVDPSADAQLYLPARYHEPLRRDFVPRGDSIYENDHSYWIRIMGRLRPGVSRQRAEAALAASFGGWVAATAETDAERTGLPSLYLLSGASGVEYLRHAFSKPLFVVVGMAALILAIACTNIANLQLARATGRGREIALRYGLGAGRWRIARQLLTESVLLSVAGGVLSLLFAWAGVRGLSAIVGEWQRGITLRPEMNWNCIAVGFGLTVLTGLLFGLAPAIHASGLPLASALRSRIGAAPGWFRGGLVTVQIAISLLLVAGASQFVRTVSNLQSVRLGFNPERLLAFDLDARQGGYREAAMARYYEEIASRLKTIPGVRAAAATSYAPASGSRSGTAVFLGSNPSQHLDTAVMWVGPDYFSTMQVPIARGRGIEARDTASAPAVFVVNETFVATYMAGKDPIGHGLRLLGDDTVWGTIVGVARDTVPYSLRDSAEPLVFPVYSQHLDRISSLTFLLRSAAASLPLAGPVRQITEAVDPRIPITNLRTVDAQIKGIIGRERSFAFLCSSFAALALLIASVGLYATLAYGVSRRTSEIGVRIALGARRGRVIAMVFRESALMIVAGVAIGLPFVMLSDKLIGSFLFRTAPGDPFALAGPAVVLLAAALIASGIPAWRAARIDPMTALRHE